MFLVLKFLSSEIFWGKKLLASIMHYVFGLMQVGIFFFYIQNYNVNNNYCSKKGLYACCATDTKVEMHTFS